MFNLMSKLQCVMCKRTGQILALYKGSKFALAMQVRGSLNVNIITTIMNAHNA